MKRIKHNNLLPWFTDDHGTLPAAYLKSCQKFFDSICWPNYYGGGADTKHKIFKLNKPQATSNKRQAVAVFTPGKRVKNRFRRNI